MRAQSLPPPAFTLAALAKKIGGKTAGANAARVVVRRLAPLQQAQSGDLSFYFDRRHYDALKKTKASAVLMAGAEKDATKLPRLLVNSPPRLCLSALSPLFYPPAPPPPPGVSKAADVHPQAKISKSAHIAANVFVGADARIGAGAVAHSGAVVGAGAIVGAKSIVHARAVLYDGVILGARCIVHAGAVIGADGFGFVRDEKRGIVKVPQTGGVRIGDDVEIGALTAIDRGALGDTIIGNDVKIDNQVQIGHNVVIGARVIICGCAGIAGSARVEDDATIGGAARIHNNVTIGARAMISACSLITKDVAAGEIFSGAMPAMPAMDWRRAVAAFRQNGRAAKKNQKTQKNSARRAK